MIDRELAKAVLLYELEKAAEDVPPMGPGEFFARTMTSPMQRGITGGLLGGITGGIIPLLEASGKGRMRKALKRSKKLALIGALLGLPLGVGSGALQRALSTTAALGAYERHGGKLPWTYYVF